MDRCAASGRLGRSWPESFLRAAMSHACKRSSMSAGRYSAPLHDYVKWTNVTTRAASAVASGCAPFDDVQETARSDSSLCILSGDGFGRATNEQPGQLT